MNALSPPSAPILRVEGLTVGFPGTPESHHVLQGVDLTLKSGEIFGLVGESGSGKSLLARSLVRLESPARITAGTILLEGEELCARTQREMESLRGKKITLVLQHPERAMDPVFRMESQFREVWTSDRVDARRQQRRFLSVIQRMLHSVGIADARRRCRQYPHQWSRGMLQRAQLVMAFSVSPAVLILDEVTSALDPTVCLQILDAIMRLKQTRHTGVILITHDLFVAAEICDRVAVMHNGRIVETGTAGDIFRRPAHPYTRLLVSSTADPAGPNAAERQ
ncbi:peptide ABC transporter ATP-binding protein [Desulfosarcina ovata subsp. sediminis]|uniref:Peptide ABC transporter ATP-binding protein n=1 Tax=Desulfosarcina ovata subsp. sediminis TaxID=885957 RepID=A0A5K7ZJI1_9BACT|nr:ABC transporter ATP-binding protein [Desulfosarcina ovata]BBO82302.1 peptide ABC transporter ATP-binding protein [Desulfosarcina ovata subsp. sediminis]